MAYNPIGVKLLRDEDELPIPQFYNPDTKKMEPLGDPRNVQLTGSIGKDFIVESNGTTLNQNDEFTILDISEPCILENIDWATNHISAQFRITLYRADGSSIGWGELVPDASAVSGISPGSIEANGSANFDIIEFNKAYNQFRFINKKDILVPTRIKITCRLLLSGTANFRWMIRGRKLR